ncbi:MAG: LysM peptidoglycan-binding domain-containing protein [Patescibacteria group bacterium]
MKPHKDEFNSIEEDWIHTEVLGQKGKKSGAMSNVILGIFLIFVVLIVILAFRSLFGKEDLSNLENLNNLTSEQTKNLSDADRAKLEEAKKAEEAKKTEDAKKAAEEEAKAKQVTYKVKSGDTLADIAAEFGVEWQKIAEANNMKEPYNIEIDQELIIPGVAPKTETPAPTTPATTTTTTNPDAPTGTTTAPTTGGTTYTVKSGDTLAGIGAELGVTWQDIAKENNMADPYPIEIGQVLKIPAKK